MYFFPFLLNAVAFFYLLAPSLTVLNFTLLNGTNFLVYILILFPFLMSFVVLYYIPVHKVRLPKGIAYSIVFLSCVLCFSLLRSYASLDVAIPSFFRFFSAIIFFIVGFYFYSFWVKDNSLKKLSFWGLGGGVLGIITFFLMRILGFSMTHSITADGMIAPLLYYTSLRPGFTINVTSIILILLSGKSANLIAYLASFVLSSVKNFKVLIFSVTLAVFIIPMLINNYETLLPSKLVMRIDLIIDLYEGHRTLDDGAGYTLTSSRYNEVMYLFNKWHSEPILFFFGDGLATTVNYSGDNVELVRNTIHFAFFKIIDMIGLFGFSFLFYIILSSFRLAVKYLKSDRVSLFSYFVLCQFFLAFFQYSLLQDPIFWISMGVLHSHCKNLSKDI